jgi:hypothetical protein
MRRFIAIISFFILSPGAYGSSVYLFTGSGTPEAQGCTLNSGAGHLGGTVDVVTQAGGGLSDALYVETTGMQFHKYSLNTGFSEFLVSARLKVTSGSHNSYDAGFMFSPFGTPELFGSLPDRSNSIYIDPAETGFMDLASSVPITSGVFHEYAILYRNNLLEIFIDNSYEDILSGFAESILSRTGPISNPGLITFGDQTNDPGVNSTYTLDFIKFQGITPAPVPLPGAIWLFGSALVGIFASISRMI